MGGGSQRLTDTPDARRWAHHEEPALSAGGLAFTDSDDPTTGWWPAEEPFEWIDDISSSALDSGEGVNLWRQHLVVTDGRTRLLYSSGV